MDPAIDTRAERSCGGFTLVELLVVVAILSVLSLGAALAVGRAPGSRSAGDTRLFAEQFDGMRTRAVLGRAATGLELTPRGWQLARFDPGTGRWYISDRVMRWRGGPRYARHGLTGASFLFDADDGPDITFLPSGRATPVQIRFSSAEDCRSDGFGPLECRDATP